MRRISAFACVAALCAAPAALAQSGQWETLAPMPTPRQEISTAALGGKVYAIAGFDAAGQSTATVEVYDPATDSWTGAAPLPIATNHNAAAVAGGRLYAFGGTSSRAFAYDPAEDRWTEVTPMNFQHGGTPAVAVIGGKIYVAGGGGAGMTGNEVEVYDPQTNRWTVLPSMRVPRNHTAGAAIGGKFYVVGGRPGSEAGAALEVYDPATNAWRRLEDMPTPRSGIAAGAIDGKLYVFGGEIPRIFPEVEVYDPATDRWTSLDPMPTPRHGIFGATIGRSIYLPGGATLQGLGATGVNEVFRVPGPAVLAVEVSGKRLTVTGENFADGATILVDGVARKTRNDRGAPATTLVSRKGAKGISSGETVTIQVRNPDGTTSEGFAFTRP